MRSVLILSLLFIFVALPPAQADFKFVGKISAPEPDSGCTSVTGLGAAGGNLFATVRCDTSSFLYLLNPGDGSVIEEKEMDGSPPACPDDSVRLISGTYEGFGHYWLGDECGNFINVIWVFDSLAVYKSFTSDTIQTPSGLCYQNDTLFAVDYNASRLAAFDLSGQLLAVDSLPQISSPTALALYRDHFFLSSATNDSLIFEISKEAAIIDTHVVEGLPGTFPLSATFLGGLLYVGSNQDSILVFRPVTYTTWVPCGDDVEVEVVPERVQLTFDHVADSCWVQVEVAEAQACPSPDSVQFFSDVYDITTCAIFEYVVHIAIQDTSEIPGAPGDVRVFSRPAGACVAFRDISVDSLQTLPILRHLSRIKSEDDEFSVFALGVDERDLVGVIQLKFAYTEVAITSNQDSIPGVVYSQIMNLLVQAETEFNIGHRYTAAVLVDSIADIVRDTPAIPHTYYPGESGHNIAGQIISSAHTLSFSLRRYDPTSGVATEREHAGFGLVLRPNPSNTSFAIEFDCDGNQPINVSIYSVRGRLVKRLLRDGRPRERISLTWHGDNEQGRLVSPGAYFALVRQGQSTAAAKIILER